MKTKHFYALPIIATLSMGTAMASMQDQGPVGDQDQTLNDTVPLSYGDMDRNATGSGSEEDDSNSTSSRSSARNSRSASVDGEEIPALESISSEVMPAEVVEEVPVAEPVAQETEESLNGWMNLTGDAREKWIKFRQHIGEFQEDGQFGLPADQQVQKAAELGPVTHTENLAEVEQALFRDTLTAIENEDWYLQDVLKLSMELQSGDPNAKKDKDEVAEAASDLGINNNNNNSETAVAGNDSELLLPEEGIVGVEASTSEQVPIAVVIGQRESQASSASASDEDEGEDSGEASGE